MGKLKWDQVGERFYETGCDHGVLYLLKDGAYPEGVAWNGLINVSENPSGGESTPLWADNMKYLNMTSAEEFGATIECYTYPDEWTKCNGEAELSPGISISQQRRSSFGFSYRTKVGNDTEGEDFGFKIHLIYGGKAATSSKTYNTVNENPEAITLSYEVTTTPVTVSGKDSDGKPFKPTAHIVIDSRYVDPETLKQLEAILYGEDETTDTEGTTIPATKPRLPLPDELKTLFAAG